MFEFYFKKLNIHETLTYKVKHKLNKSIYSLSLQEENTNDMIQHS